MKQSYVSSQKIGPDGRPVKETYGTKAKGAFGNGKPALVERHQMYENSGTGLQKAAHERMMNGKGRKVIREKVGHNMNEYD